MRRQVIRNVSGVLVLLGACGGKVQTPVDPEPVSAPVADAAPVQPEQEPPLPKFLPGEPIVEVSGDVASFPSIWAFDPRGEFVAEIGNPWEHYGPDEQRETVLEFTLFEIETGARVGTFACGELPEDPCRDWILPDSPTRPSPDLAMFAIPDGADIELHTSADPASAAVDAIPCPGCKDVVSMAWSPDGSQLAVARKGAPRVELWNIGSKKKTATLKLDGKHRYAGEVSVGWSAEGLSAMADRKPTSDEENYMYEAYGSDYVPYGYESALPVLHTWADPGATASVRVLSPGGKSDHHEANDELIRFRTAVLDPLGRFVWAIETDWGSRESIGERLAVYSLGEAGSALSWDGTHVPWGGDTPFYPVHDNESFGDWVVSDRAQWHSSTLMASDWDERLKVEFAAITFGPEPRKWTMEVDPIDDAISEVTNVDAGDYVFAGIHEGQPIAYARVCFHERTWDEKTDKSTVGPEKCVGEAAPEIAGCETVEFSPDATWLMARCGQEVKVAPRKDTSKAVALAATPTAAWRWLELGLLVDDGKGGVDVLDPATGKSTLHLAHSAMIRTPLAPEQDRFVVQTAEALEVRDAASGKLQASIETEGTSYAAMSPNGEQIAFSDGDHMAVASLESGKVLRRWKVDDLTGMAWRQDGASILSAHKSQLPEQAWNPETGKLDPDLMLPAGVLDNIAPEQLDPSWRFAVDYDGNILRLLDGVMLEQLETDNPVTSNGWHASYVPKSHRYVVHHDPLTYRLLHPADVEPYVVRKSLLKEFMAGHPLPPPTWPEDRPLPKRKGKGKGKGKGKAQAKAARQPEAAKQVAKK